MSDIHDKTGKAPDIPADKQKFLDELNSFTAERVNSWSDLYAGLKQQAHSYFSSPNKGSADFAMCILLCFVTALEELPEEGDARKIAEHMNYLLVMGGDRTGVEVTFATEEERAQRVKPDKLIEALARVAGMLAEELPKDEDGTPVLGTKRTLH